MGETTNKKINLLTVPFDVFERHKMVAVLVEKDKKVLDVGGGVDALGRFIKNKIVVSNLQSGDVLADGRSLPFADNSFEIVTSIDVIEHISQKDRQKFVKELIRVAGEKVILSSPLGTKQHLGSEKKILSFLKKKGANSAYLEEHVKEVLPSEEELKKYAGGYRFQILASGDFRLSNFLTKMDVTSLKNPYFDKLFYFFKRLVNIILNIFYFPFCRSNKTGFFTNRIYLLIEKNN
jgi:hypothetical protein